MCNRACLEFLRCQLSASDIFQRRVLEVGSRDVNGSARPHVELLGPAAYVGVDIEEGLGVDEICAAEALVDRFGSESFDVVISTELLEHVKDWTTAVNNMKGVLRDGGILLVTTRSKGFRVHGFPNDYWRYEPADMEAIFGDMDIQALERDSIAPGVFLRARKARAPQAVDLSELPLYSVLTRRRVLTVSRWDEMRFRAIVEIHKVYRFLLPEGVRRCIKRLIGGLWLPPSAQE
jgi:SAM-dependent methyltransferase